MERKIVESSNILSIGYDEDNRILEVEFPGGVYKYSEIPKQVYEEFMAAPSYGRYFYQNIRDKYNTEKVLRNYG